MTSEYWAPNLFKGRLGEAIVESVLAEFGYVVRRAGFEQLLTADTPQNRASQRIAPDLWIQDPIDGKVRWVEVKYRSARPLSIQIDGGRMRSLAKEYPEAVLAFVSAYNGSVFCAEAGKLPIGNRTSTVTLSLSDEYWQPIWHYFPRVNRGEGLRSLWKNLQEILGGFGKMRIRRHTLSELWPGETQALINYVQDAWGLSMTELGIPQADIERLTLEDLWERAREINGLRLALDLHEEDPIETKSLLATKMKAQGVEGEQNLVVDLEATAAAIGLEQEYRFGIAAFLAGLIKGEGPVHDRLARQLIKDLPDGVGEAYLLDPGFPTEEATKVDLKSAIMLADRRFRLDR